MNFERTCYEELHILCTYISTLWSMIRLTKFIEIYQVDWEMSGGRTNSRVN